MLVEALVGYPRWLFAAIGHPVTWMGALLSVLDRRLNRDMDTPGARRLLGGLALLALLFVTVATASAASMLVNVVAPGAVTMAILAVPASSCLAQRSLDAHVLAVAEALESRGIAAARRAVGDVVGRNTAALDEAGICRAAIESLAENFADGIVAPAFWLIMLGLPGAFAYKAINTADSMVGHRTIRHEAFGCCAAKLDDAVNLLPARLAAVLLALAAAFVPDASTQSAWRVMRRDARGHPSPNAGWPEAAMAGALGIRLGGPRSYAERTVHDAFIGDPGRRLDAQAIRAALRVYRIGCVLQFVGVAILAAVIALWR